MATYANKEGIEGASFQVGGPVVGPLVKSVTGIVQIRNAADSAFNDVSAGNMRVNDPIVGVDDGGSLIGNGIARHGTGVQSYGVGTGAVIGNARGTGSLDLQALRTAATQVPAGNTSVAWGAQNASTRVGSVLGGFGNSAANTTANAGWAFGRNNASNGQRSVAFGDGNNAPNNPVGGTVFGTNNQLNGTTGNAGCVAFGTNQTQPGSSTIARSFGDSNSIATSSPTHADHATVFGQSVAANFNGQIGISGGMVAGRRVQSEMMTWGGQTVDATTASINTNGSLNGITFQYLLTTNAVAMVELIMVASIAGATDAKVFTFDVAIRRSGAALIFIGGIPPATVVAQDAALAAATAVLSTGVTAGSFQINVTGLAATTINWTATAMIAKGS